MGTKIYCESYFQGFHSMGDLNGNSSSSSWFYGDKTVLSGQYFSGITPRASNDGYSGHYKDSLKQKMLEHDAVFRNQVCELHRLYRIQRDMMEEVKRKEVHKHHRASTEPASSSSHHGSQVLLEEARKWHMAGFSLLNSSYGKPSGKENINSPMSCTKGIATPPGQPSFLNGSTSKDSEALDSSRPLKVRKKLFNLQLPADHVDSEYEENLSSYTKNDGLMDASASTSRLWASCDLADLNEPIRIVETAGPSSVDFLGCTSENVETRALYKPVKTTSGYLGVGGDTMLVRDGFLINSSTEIQINEKRLLSHTNKAGSSMGNLYSVMQGCQLDKLPLPSHAEKITYLSGYGREDLWREGFRHGLESSRSYDRSDNSLLGTMTYQNKGSYPFFSSSSFASSWAQPISSWAKTKLNGYPHASASEYKELHVQSLSAGFDHPNNSRDDDVAFDRSTNHGFSKFVKGSYHADPKPIIDINLNEEPPNSLLSETVVLPDAITADGKDKPEDNLQILPWLKPKSVTSQKETQKILGVPIFERDVPENEPSSHMSNIISNKRKNGMIDINVACWPDKQISDEEPTLEKEKLKNGAFVIDLNSCASDYEDPPYEQKSTSLKITLEIDLEAPVLVEGDDDSTLEKEKTPEEVLSQPFENKHEQIKDDVLTNAVETLVTISSCPKVGIEDSICRLTESSLEEALVWFVDAVSSYENYVAEASRKESKDPEPSEEVDDFEAMTLQLAETREEDYMPEPFIPGNSKFEEMVPNALTTRSRRGHSRRGRQRRDFQRDILPGLASLSRHEVTEDIQTFGGLMRATGHSWNLGLARRNGTRNSGARGRRRVVVEMGRPATPGPICAPLIKQLNTVEGGLEDRSLTGWGKTTRRPRRQRCPPPTVVMT